MKWVTFLMACGAGCSQSFHETGGSPVAEFKPAEQVHVQLYPKKWDQAGGWAAALAAGQTSEMRVDGDYLQKYYAAYDVGQGAIELRSTVVRLVGWFDDQSNIRPFHSVADAGFCKSVTPFDNVCVKDAEDVDQIAFVSTFEISGMDAEWEHRWSASNAADEGTDQSFPSDVGTLPEQFSWIGRGADRDEAYHFDLPDDRVAYITCRWNHVTNTPSSTCSGSYRPSNYVVVRFEFPRTKLAQVSAFYLSIDRAVTDFFTN